MDGRVIQLSPTWQRENNVLRDEKSAWLEDASEKHYLDAVDKAKEVGRVGSVVSVKARGWMENMTETCVEREGEEWVLGGIVSGHGPDPSETTQLVSEGLSRELVAGFKNVNSTNHSKLVDISRKAHAMTDTLLPADAETSGCMSATAFVTKNLCICSTVGKCGAFLCRNGKLIPLTAQHVPSSSKETVRIEAAGSSVDREGKLDGVLTCSRLFGMAQYKRNEEAAPEAQAVVATPDVTLFTMQASDTFVLLGNDDFFKSIQKTPSVSLETLTSVTDIHEAEIALCEMVDTCFAPSIPHAVGAGNISACLILLNPKTEEASRNTLFTTSAEMLDIWNVLGISCMVVRQGSLRSQSQNLPPSLRQGLNKLDEKYDSGERNGDRSSVSIRMPSRETLRSAADSTKAIRHFPTPVHMFKRISAVMSCMMAVRGVWDASRGELYQAVVHFVAALMLVVFSLFLHRCSIPPGPAKLEAATTAFSTVYIVTFDLVSNCENEIWICFLIAILIHATFPSPDVRYIAATIVAATSWVVLRVLETSEGLGMCRDPSRKSEWAPGEIFIRAMAMVGAGLIGWQLRNEMHRNSLMLTEMRKCLAMTAQIATTSDASEADQVLLMSGKADRTGAISNSLFEIIGFIKKVLSRRSKSTISDLSLLEYKSDAPSTTSEEGDEMETCDDSHINTLSETTIKSKQSTVLCISLSHEFDIAAVTTFSDVTCASIESCDGSIITYSGNMICSLWNAFKPSPYHAQQAVTCAMTIHSRLHCCQWNIAITTGSLYIGKEGVKGKRLGFAVGKPLSLSYPLVKWAKNIQVTIVLQDKVYEQVRSIIYARPIDSVQLQNDRPDIMYELQGSRKRPCPATCSPSFTEAFSSMQQLRLSDAIRQFSDFLKRNPSDKQARRLLQISTWLSEYENVYISEAYGYCRHLSSELEYICAEMLGGDNWSFAGSDYGSMTGSPKRKSMSESTMEFDGSVKRESLQHDKILRRQIRDAEAEANADQLVAWGLMPDNGKPVLAKKEKSLPTRFTDHKSREWCRAERCLGKGAFGEVWLGMAADGSLVAMKSMRLPTAKKTIEASSTNLSAAARRRLARKAGGGGGQSGGPSDLQQIEDLLREVGLMHKLRHENIVSYMASAVVDGFIMIVMEYLSGGSLHDMLVHFSVGSIPQTSLQRYVQDIVRGLEFLHAHDIIHRDMKPHNVLLNVEGQCKLADFGASAGLSQLAKTNQGVIGTPLYMSPEACRGAACKASDVWGLGIMMCQLFTGVVPYVFPPDEPFNPHTFLYKLGNTSDFIPIVPTTLPHDARNMAASCLQNTPESRPAASELMSFPFVLN